MTDNPNPKLESNAPDGAENTENMIPKSRFDEVNRKYRETLSRLEALEKAQTERDEAQRKQRETELTEQNQFKQLYEAAKAEVEDLKSLQNEVKRYRDSFESTLKTRLESIPEDRQHLVPEFEDPIKLSAWLDKAMPDLAAPLKPSAPRLDGGSGSSTRGNSLKLTDYEIQVAREAGMSLEAYAAAKAAKGQPLDLSKPKQE